MSIVELLPALADAAAADVTLLSDAQLRGDILDLVRAANLVQAALASRMVCFDRRELAQADGFRSAGQWLSAFGRLSPHAAGVILKRGRLLEELPVLGAAAARGVVSTEQVAKVADVVSAVGVDVVRQVDTVLADLAAVGTPKDVEVACHRVRGYADPDGPEPDPEKVLQRRSLGLARVGDMVRVRGQLDPEAGAAVMTALDALMAPPSVEDARTATQRRADALTDLARLALTTDVLPVTGGHRPQIGLLITPEALLRTVSSDAGTGGQVPQWWTRLAHQPGTDGAADTGGGPAGPGAPTPRPATARRAGLEPPDASPDGPDPLAAAGILHAPQPGELTWAGAIATATAQRLACDSILYRVIYDPATGLPLDVGRSHRTAPSWIRKALHARDRGCRWPGCQAPTPWTDGHHLTWWTEGGETKVNDMLLLCRWHHTRVHKGQWSIRLDARTGQVFVTRPDGRPYEIPPSPTWLRGKAA